MLQQNTWPGKDGLGAYTADPTVFGPERIVYFNDEYVVIKDLYPKASIHLLVLTRNSEKNILHPFDAFEDLEFLAKTKVEVERTKEIVASELRRRFGSGSTQDKVRLDAIESDEPSEELPQGRNWLSEIKSGIHAHPSMNHLHVHVFSPDMVSDCMRHRKHYESFNTDFLVPLEAFPLSPEDPRRHPRQNGIVDVDLVCWRCSKNFGNKFTRFKEHLAEEFEEWKKL